MKAALSPAPGSGFSPPLHVPVTEDSPAATRSPGGWPRVSTVPLLPPAGAQVGIPFIIETGHESFNPSILNVGDTTLMVWRQGWNGATIQAGVLNGSLQLVRQHRLELERWVAGPHAAFEDPRLFLFRGAPHVSFTVTAGCTCEMAIARLGRDLEILEVRIFRGGQLRTEKNWQFFGCHGILHAVYLVNPHMTGAAGGTEAVFPADAPVLGWEWGEARGGTPPVRIGKEYFSFFHSSQGGNYVAGFYAFEGKPPFRVTRWPVLPCLTAEGSPWRTWGPKVVFPGGAVFRNGFWTVAFGWHDTHCCLARWRHAELLKTLRPAAECRLPAHLRFSESSFRVDTLAARERDSFQARARKPSGHRRAASAKAPTGQMPMDLSR